MPQELEIEQLAHFSLEDKNFLIFALVDKLAAATGTPTRNATCLLQKKHSAVDIAHVRQDACEFPSFNTEAAVQVAHAITVHGTWRWRMTISPLWMI